MKKAKSIPYLLIIAALSLATPSCTKDAATNANLNVSVQMSNTTYSLPVTAGISKSTASTPSITWMSGTMFVSQLAFNAEMSESSTTTNKTIIAYDWKGPLNIDLFKSSILGNIELPVGYYDKIELEVKLNKSDAAGTPVVYLTGNYTNASGNVIPVIFTSYEDMNFKAKQDGVAITAASGSKFTASVQIFMDQTLTGMTLAQIDNAPLTNGKLEISATSNAMLYNIMLTNMKGYQHCSFQ